MRKDGIANGSSWHNTADGKEYRFHNGKWIEFDEWINMFKKEKKPMSKLKKEILDDWDDNCIRQMIEDIIDRVRAATLDEVEEEISTVAEKRMCSLVWNVELKDVKQVINRLRKKYKLRKK